MEEGKRVRRTAEQIAADIDAQIGQLEESIGGIEEKKAAVCAEYDRKADSVREKIAKLEARKKALFAPKKRKPRKKKADQIKELIRQAQRSGMKLDEIADKLGVEITE